jgi:hypothetical protein
MHLIAPGSLNPLMRGGGEMNFNAFAKEKNQFRADPKEYFQLKLKPFHQWIYSLRRR